MRTLVISDLHLGSLLQRDVLRRPAALLALADHVAEADRLVLLGDTLELYEGRPDAVAAVARPILQKLAGALPAGGEIVVVTGNHDHALVRARIRAMRANGTPLRPTAQLPRTATPELEALCSWLRPAHVEVRYPGVWLEPGVWATHGHYLDRHLVDALLGRTPAEGSRMAAMDYEGVPGLDAGWIGEAAGSVLPEPIAARAEDAVAGIRRALATGVPLLAMLPGAAALNAAGPMLLDHGMHQRAALPAMAAVARRLRLSADWVIFGHIHRRGPLRDDPPPIWAPLGGGGPRLVNSGSWVYDSVLTGTGSHRPYRPGGAVLVESGRDPRPLDLLADVPDDVMRVRV